MYKRVFKRLIDIIVSFLGLLLVIPILLFSAILLAVNNKGRIFFIQKRPGYKGKPFNIIKFKTMNEKKDPHGVLLEDDQRTTALGKFIRNTSIDELPQLINVLKGDLSLIGPRPLLMEYLPLYSKHQARRHDVKPGISGWAQVTGRNTFSWEQKFEYDLYYVDHLSFALDVKIFFLTLFTLFQFGGNVDAGISKKKFNGSNN